MCSPKFALGPRLPRSTSAGFTLLELLDVMAIAAVKDGTSNTIMFGERLPMTVADAWTLEVLARAWVTPLR